ncbi:MAG: PfkB family carbohydrate kinase [Candidatus Diapherotrites archaeon]|nr:PfkB family carbohydrate kinase [Candidatus Diapherotrites archaeon]
MPKMVVVGTIAFDSIKTPFGETDSTLGGSASYAAVAASFFTKPGIVSVVGSDFPEKHLRFFESRGIDTAGIEKAAGETFRWSGEYGMDINIARTLETKLNVLSSFSPKLPEEYRKADFLLLGNIDPELQLKVLGQMRKKPLLVIADTMNYWIENKRKKVLEVVKKADICLMNDSEARQLFGTPNLVQAAKKILELDSRLAIIKKGEHGALLCTAKGCFTAPAYPLENVVDPTGCGDSFAGAMMGVLAQSGDLSEDSFRRAVMYGNTVASFNAEGMGLQRMLALSKADIERRFREFREIVRF